MACAPVVAVDYSRALAVWSLWLIGGSKTIHDTGISKSSVEGHCPPIFDLANVLFVDLVRRQHIATTDELLTTTCNTPKTSRITAIQLSNPKARAQRKPMDYTGFKGFKGNQSYRIIQIQIIMDLRVASSETTSQMPRPGWRLHIACRGPVPCGSQCVGGVQSAGAALSVLADHQ